jgi:hypothetical protein
VVLPLGRKERMMSRYVDIEPYEKLEGWTTYVTLTVNRPDSQISIPVSSIPTADVDEVVRCAECKWFQCNMGRDGVLPNEVPEYECRHWCGECDPTDFCSYAERKTE